jgi:hypothetical protein
MISDICLSEISYSGKSFDDTTAEYRDLSDIFGNVDYFEGSNKHSGKFLIISCI